MSLFQANTTIGPYCIGGLLGEGAMGRVYAGQKEGYGQVAIKVAIAPEFESLLESEARALRLISHANVVPFVDWIAYNGAHALVMGFVEGESLEERFARQPLTNSEVDTMASRIGAGLAAAHRAGIVHSDLKPSNIIIRDDGEPILLDFGASQVTVSAHADPIGTLAYMPPEQVLGQPATPASDQFSFGVVLYESICGRRPFSGYHTAALEYEICHQDPPPLEDVNSAVSGPVSVVVSRLLAKSPDARFPSMEAFLLEWSEAQKVEVGGISVRRLVVAVSPFVNEMGDTSLEYISRALGDQVQESLETLTGLVLVSRDTVAAQEKAQADRITAAAAVGADYFAGGRFYKAGDQLQVVAEMVSVPNKKPLWSNRYRGALDQFFDLQDRIADDLAAQFRALLPEQAAPVSAATEPEPRVLELYRRARELYYRGDQKDLDDATELYEQALEIDPAFNLARAGLADCYINYYMRFIDRRPAWLDKAERVARKALEQDPNTAAAYRSLGRVAQQRGDSAKAEENFQKAIEIDPRYAEAMRSLGWLCSERKDFERALYWTGEALKAAPADREASLLRGITYLDQRNYAHAERALRELVRLHPEYGWGHLYLGETLQKAGRFSEARNAFRDATKGDDFEPEAFRNLGRAAVYLHDWDDARETFMRNIGAGIFEFEAHYYLGLIAHLLGNEQAARTSWENSRIVCERAVTKDPSDQYPQLFLGLVRAALGDAGAYDSILTVRRQDPSNGELAYFEARAAQLLGDTDRAEACVFEALHMPLGPSHAEYSADPHFPATTAAAA
jgi:tetratricopeptide (TPR) repeat protein/predicted Ser/Thr protein kinase